MTDHAGARKADLAAIHVAKKELGWDDDMYRDVMFAVCRVRSSAELDFTGRKRFLAHLRACVARMAPSAQAGQKNAAKAAKRPEWAPPQRKIWALWQSLANKGHVKDRRLPALQAWLKSLTGVDRLEWLSYPQEHMAIEALKKWYERPVGGAGAEGGGNGPQGH